MFMHQVLLMVLFVGFAAAGSGDHPEVPEPEIQVSLPRGLLMSLEDIPGLSVVLFNVNVYRKSGKLEDKKFSQYIRRKQDGKWMLARRQLRMEIGDKITYSVFVVKDGMAFVSSKGECQIEELAHPDQSSNTTNRRQRKPGKCRSSDEPLPPPVSERPDTFDETKHYLSLCEEAVINSTHALISLQSQVAQLEKENQQLLDVLAKYPDAKKLTISGRIPPNDHPLTTVQVLLTEKLDLNPHVVSAVRNPDSSITFEVETLNEKLEILEVAKETLTHSKIIIN